MALISRFGEPPFPFNGVSFDPFTIEVHDPQIVLGIGISRIGRLKPPVVGKLQILWCSNPLDKVLSKDDLCSLGPRVAACFSRATAETGSRISSLLELRSFPSW